MRKPEPKARILDKASPFRIAPMACSRTPKCMLRPPRLSASRSPAPSKVRRVLVDGSETAAPRKSRGVFGRGREARRAADEPGVTRRDGVQHLRRGIAAGDALGVG